MSFKLSDYWTSQSVLSKGSASYLYDSANGLVEFRLWISDQQGEILTTCDIDASNGDLGYKGCVSFDYGFPKCSFSMP